VSSKEHRVYNLLAAKLRGSTWNLQTPRRLQNDNRRRMCSSHGSVVGKHQGRQIALQTRSTYQSLRWRTSHSKKRSSNELRGMIAAATSPEISSSIRNQ